VPYPIMPVQKKQKNKAVVTGGGFLGDAVRAGF
jgi:hypothetical protein